MIQKYTFFLRKSTKKSLKSAPLSIIILLFETRDSSYSPRTGFNSVWVRADRRGGEVFKVLVLDRIQQRIWSRSLKFLFLRVGGEVAEVFKVLSQCRIQQRLRSRSLTFQLSIFLPGQGSSSSSSGRLRDDADEALQGFFALFPVRKKVRSLARTRGQNCSPSRAHPRGELMRTGMRQGDVAIDVFFAQLIDGYGRPCAHAETCLQSWT